MLSFSLVEKENEKHLSPFCIVVTHFKRLRGSVYYLQIRFNINETNSMTDIITQHKATDNGFQL